MKYLSLIITLIFISSCCGSNNVSDNNSNDPVSTEITPTEPIIIEETDTLKENSNSIQEQNEIESQPAVKSSIDVSDTSEAFNHEQWNSLLNKHVSKSGNVNYKGILKDIESLKSYITALGKNMPTETWTKNDKLAYWINAYNALTVDLIVRNYPVKSIKDIDDPWEQRLWNLGGKWFNLEEIEHQILRKMNEPRIHFGIVCASFSCPKLLNEAYTAEQLELQLTEATRSFLADSKRNNISENELNLSKIFQWFAKDFKQNGSLIDFIDQYSDIHISPNAKKRYKDYNWDLNE